jgi:amino acid permease
MFVLVGWGMGYVLLIVGAVASVWSNLIIAYLSEKYRLPNYD